MHVVGTAGHVDHGKSTLIEALTGIDPDRLKEEKERQMTIDLGFAWIFPEEGHDEIGIIDVPGHRDFIENMLAGIGGIDLALLVVAADEGVMPQTREHLAILDLLQIKAGIVALTKVDLVEDPDWLELVQLEIAEAIQGTVLEHAEIIPVSATQGFNIGFLKSRIITLLDQLEKKPDWGRPRLPIDRVFSLTGFGTIVTGTLVGGHLVIGDEVEIQPGNFKARIRGIQTHQTKRAVAKPGSRVALNLTGVAKDDLKRGQVLTTPGILKSTLLCDASYNHLGSNDGPLKHNINVKFFVGSAEVLARTRIIGTAQINPGHTGWLQLSFSEPVAIVKGDRFILRRPSPPATIGGGTVLDPYPGRRYKRFRPEVLSKFEVTAQGSPEEIMLLVLRQRQPIRKTDLIQATHLLDSDANEAWDILTSSDQIKIIADQVYSKDGWESLVQKSTEIVDAYHIAHPLRLGLPREELRSRLGIGGKLFGQLLDEANQEGFLSSTNSLVKNPNHIIIFNDSQRLAVESLQKSFESAGVNSLSTKEVKQIVGAEVYDALIDLGEIVQVSDDVVYARALYLELVEEITSFLKENGRVNAAQLRDLLKTSRKYSIALLEHLDDLHITQRLGDDRILVAES